MNNSNTNYNTIWNEQCRWLDQLPCDNNKHFANLKRSHGWSSPNTQLPSTLNTPCKAIYPNTFSSSTTTIPTTIPTTIISKNSRVKEEEEEAGAGAETTAMAIRKQRHPKTFDAEWSVMPFSPVNGSVKRSEMHLQELKREPHNIFLRPLYKAMPRSMQHIGWEDPKADQANIPSMSFVQSSVESTPAPATPSSTTIVTPVPSTAIVSTATTSTSTTTNAKPICEPSMICIPSVSRRAGYYPPSNPMNNQIDDVHANYLDPMRVKDRKRFKVVHSSSSNHHHHHHHHHSSGNSSNHSSSNSNGNLFYSSDYTLSNSTWNVI
ncbi:hypothetical protein BDF22DRAFT_693151 [Syncephalis plumigaleata]|nr:hypothetical protein BDF22DRAFT_693151 [Syncephalis plumigaleata]